MEYRDANANDLSDFIDLHAMAAGQPTFPELPELAGAGNTPPRLACSKTGPGQIPPPIPTRTPTQKLAIRSARVSRRQRGLVVELQTDHGTITDVEVELRRGSHRLAHRHVAQVGTSEHRTILRVDGRAPTAGRYTLIVRKGGRTLARRSVVVGGGIRGSRGGWASNACNKRDTAQRVPGPRASVR
jgi:hypothetical protein